MSQFDNVSVVKKANVYFDAPGNASFEIETIETLDYVCHFK